MCIHHQWHWYTVLLQQQSSTQNKGLRHSYCKQDSAESVLSVTLVHIECWISPFLRGRRRHVVVTNLYTWIGDKRGRRSRMPLFVTSDGVFNSASTVPSLITAPLTMCSVFQLYTFFEEKVTKTNTRYRRTWWCTGHNASRDLVFELHVYSTTAIPLSSLSGTLISTNGFTFLFLNLRRFISRYITPFRHN